MKNILFAIFENKQKCLHKNALLNSDRGYCPDCGQYLLKNYYLVRCSRCDIKRQAKISWGEILPKEKFCKNCGASKFYIEKIENVNIIDANYAVYLKEIAQEKSDLHPEVQIWINDDKKIEKLTDKSLSDN